MALDTIWLWSFLTLFVRASAMFLVSPLTGLFVPVPIRIMSAAVLALALAPFNPLATSAPADAISLLLGVGAEALIGMVIGFSIVIVVQVIMSVGALLDLQLGLSAAQILNPVMGVTATPVGQFKYMLAIVLLFCLGAHQGMILAFINADPAALSTAFLQEGVVSFFSRFFWIALQLAIPVAGVATVIDLSAGLINKAVPQTMPFLLSLPAKTAAGMLALALTLPFMSIVAQSGVELMMDFLEAALTLPAGGGT